jgi:hypothetical protein
MQIVDQVVRLPGFHDYVIYVRLNSPPDVVSENVLHTSLIRSARVSEAKWHVTYQNMPNGVMKEVTS